MRTTYAALLAQVEASGFDVLGRPDPTSAGGRARSLPLWRRAAIAGATLMRTGALGRPV
jgi:hypothetical protein